MRTVDDKVIVALHQIRDAIKNKDCCNGSESGGENENNNSNLVRVLYKASSNNNSLSIENLEENTDVYEVRDDEVVTIALKEPPKECKYHISWVDYYTMRSTM